MGVRARVTVTLEIEAKSHWSATVNAQQVYDQAIADVLGALRNNRLVETGYKVIGEPHVVAVLVDLK
jgi:hypothetical protein